MTPPDAPAGRSREVLPSALLRLASDERLVDQVRAGSERAFEAIFDRHHRPVLSLCIQMLGSRADAEDALQHTFLNAYRDLKRSDRSIALRPWLYAIARHRCLSVLRSRRERPLDELPQPAGDHLDVVVGTREDLRATLADVAQLPEDQRRALVLAGLGDVPHDEIARALGCRREKVKALLFQARTALADDRAARDASCATIRDRLGTAGGGLRHAVVRRHLRDCPGCRAFHSQLRARRGALGLLLPLIGIKRVALAVLPGLGGGGAAVTAGAMGGGGVAVIALASVAIGSGGGDAGATAASGARESMPRAAVASEPRLRTAAAAAPGSLREARKPVASRLVRGGVVEAARLRTAAPATAVAHARAEPAAAPEPVTERGEAERADPPADAPAEAPAAQAAPEAPGPSAGDEKRPTSRGQAESHEPGGPGGHAKRAERPAPPEPNGDHGPAAPNGRAGTAPAPAAGKPPAPDPAGHGFAEPPAAAQAPPSHATGRDRAAEMKPSPPSVAVVAG